MDPQRRYEAFPEPTERDYREGVIIAVILGLVLIFEFYLKPMLAGPLQGRTEVCIILFAIGLIHLLGSHLLAFLYNCKHFVLLHDLGVCRGQALPRHARAVGFVFLLAGIVRWLI